MSCLKPVSTAALLAVLSAPAAFADVTGAQVWDDWKSYMQGFGYEVSGSEAQSGDTLTVSDITMSMDLPEGEGNFSMTMGNLAFVDNGDGTVAVELPTQMPMTFNVTPAVGEAAAGTVLVQQTAPAMTVSGDPGDFTYEYSADSASMTLQQLEADGQQVSSEMMSAVMTISEIASTTRTTVGDMRGYDGQFTAARISYDVSFDVPEGPDQGSGTIKGEVNNVTANGSGMFPPDVNSADLGAMIAAGTNVDSTLTYSGGSSEIQAVSPDGPFAASSKSTGGTFKVSMNGDGLVYDLSGTGVEMTAQVPDLPFPVSLAMEEAGFKLGLPVAVKEEPQGFAFGFKFGDFTISDMIWGMIDPAGQLPRDPATLELDLSGTATVLTDIFDPMAMASNEAPGELNSVSINTLLVDLIGARLSGSGAFTFDNTDMMTFNGMPRPEGALDLRLQGANALLDKLTAMGLLPQEQAMGARMMMGLFGVPEGDDTLTSKIEVNEQGHVLANGQRLQ